MKTAVLAYLSTAMAMLCLDAVWLSLAAPRLYRPQLGDLLRSGFAPLPALLFYLVYVLGIVVLAVYPALADGRLATATARGAMLGLAAYATYDLTNQATLRHWSTLVTISDLGWGTVLTAFAATVGCWLTTSLAARIG